MKKFLNTMRKFNTKMKAVILIIEALLAIFLIAMVVLGFFDLGKLLLKMIQSDAFPSYGLVQQILSHTLLLAIGIELSLMLINHSPSGVLEVALYAVAKKMLISSGSTLDLLIGALGLAVIFAIDKYLHSTGDIGNLFRITIDELEPAHEEAATKKEK